MDHIFHLLWHGTFDTLKLLPFLFAAYLLLEYVEHKSAKRLSSFLSSGKYGVPGGAVLGCIPQCGMSVAASHMYAAGAITGGTLVAVFISTSDEAIPVLLANMSGTDKLLPLIFGKLAFAVLCGYLYDLTLGKLKLSVHHKHRGDDCPIQKKINDAHSHSCSSGCESHILKGALKHTLKTALFILIVNVAAEFLMHFVGEEAVAEFLSRSGVLSPLIAALVGLIPSCASSVIITELYIEGVLPLGAAFAGLSVGSGVGIFAMFSANKNIGQNILLVVFIFVLSVIAGTVLQAVV